MLCVRTMKIASSGSGSGSELTSRTRKQFRVPLLEGGQKYRYESIAWYAWKRLGIWYSFTLVTWGSLFPDDHSRYGICWWLDYIMLVKSLQFACSDARFLGWGFSFSFFAFLYWWFIWLFLWFGILAEWEIGGVFVARGVVRIVFWYWVYMLFLWGRRCQWQSTTGVNLYRDRLSSQKWSWDLKPPALALWSTAERTVADYPWDKEAECQWPNRGMKWDPAPFLVVSVSLDGCLFDSDADIISGLVCWLVLLVNSS